MVAESSSRKMTLTEVVEGHGPSLFSIIRRQVRDQAEAEDVLQEVFAEYVSAYNLNEAIEYLGAWLVTVARNKIRDRFRRKKTEASHKEALKTESELSLPEAPPEDEWTRGWLRNELLNAIESLPERQRDVFVMHELEGKSFDEIATLTGDSVNTLLSRKRYAVINLRNYLKEVYDELE